MKTKVVIGALFMLFAVSCKVKTVSKGRFFEGITLGKERYFTHNLIQESNPLKKITDAGGFSYYSWKTIRTLYSMHNDNRILDISKVDSSLVSIYNTVTNDSLLNFRNDRLAYIQKDKNVHFNNLYFIDNYRCIYLSFDDRRAKNTTILPLYFDLTSYKVPSKNRKRFEQYLRGYYTIQGTEIFFHFENSSKPKQNFFVTGKLNADHTSIEFTSMTIPDSPTDLNGNGYNANLINFKTVFHPKAQPVFESVNSIREKIYIPQNYLSFGFELYKGSKKLNDLHRKILDKYSGELKENDILIINSVSYNVDGPCSEGPNSESYGYRSYRFYKYGFPEKNYIIEECIGLNEISKRNENMIDTW